VYLGVNNPIENIGEYRSKCEDMREKPVSNMEKKGYCSHFLRI